MTMEALCTGVKCSKKGWIDPGVMHNSGAHSTHCARSEAPYLEKNESKTGNLSSREIL